MIDSFGIDEIIALYEKHGWVLRRVLLTDELKAVVGERFAGVLPHAHVQTSGIDAAWFSRPPKTGVIPWEIRYLGDPPFALLEFLDEADDDFETALSDVEQRLTKSVLAKRSA
ncbi:MAG TPA: hypothetical protein VNA17_04500 [Pyrinomonadaceae bacterium]|nr:hypothetical protein [Pyrinomonadaceae bacterium]